MKNPRFTLQVIDHKAGLEVTIGSETLKSFTDPNAMPVFKKTKAIRTQAQWLVEELAKALKDRAAL